MRSMWESGVRALWNTTGAERVWESIYSIWAPWDVAEPPPELKRELAGDHGFERGLDLGCGTGRLTVYLAHRGLTAHGVDISPSALGDARDRPQDATFWAVDVTDADAVRAAAEPPYDLVVDYGCLHSIPSDTHDGYLETLLAVTEPGSTYLLWTLSDEFPIPFPLPSIPDVEGLVEDHFAVETTEKTRPQLPTAAVPAALDFYRMRRL